MLYQYPCSSKTVYVPYVCLRKFKHVYTKENYSLAQWHRKNTYCETLKIKFIKFIVLISTEKCLHLHYFLYNTHNYKQWRNELLPVRYEYKACNLLQNLEINCVQGGIVISHGFPLMWNISMQETLLCSASQEKLPRHQPQVTNLYTN